MIVSIHQPYYFPWLGYFEKVLRSDVFVVLDDDLYTKNNFYNRNRIKNANGAAWITVPVKKDKKDVSLLDIKIANNQKWQKKHFDSLFFNYKKAPYFYEHLEFFEKIYLKTEWEKLIDLNVYTLNYFFDYLDIRSRIEMASKLKIKTTATKRLVEICKFFGADEYYSGSSGKKYMETALFEKNNISISYQDYSYPIYKQQYHGFVSNLSIIDLLLNHGPASRELVLAGSTGQ